MSNNIKLTNTLFQNINVENGNVSGSGSTGTMNHDKLKNRDLPNQHPISSITGLEDKLKNIGNGVYVGSGDMPEDCNIQIDPSGKIEDYATQEYVENALKNIGGAIKYVDLGNTNDGVEFDVDWTRLIPTPNQLWNSCDWGVSVVTFDYGDNPKFIIVIKDNWYAMDRVQVIDNGKTYYCECASDPDPEYNFWTDLNYNKSDIDTKIGDIDSALDELHNYAQALIGGDA